ncbi:MAG: GntR family transcriptional regulator [Deltaproteobacteria bacterium]|nr:GntR family transcriptional regulator [Deltaproteobacteria bacterium]
MPWEGRDVAKGRVMNYYRRNEDPTPIYFRIQQEIKEEIESGRLNPHDAVPTEQALARKYQVSVGTIKRAVLNLVNEGYLFRIQGKGTFVAGTTLQRGSLRYYRLLRRLKADEADIGVNLIDLETISCFEPINEYLSLRLNQKLYRVRRVFTLEDKPVVYTDSYLPRALLPGLDKRLKESLEKITFYHAVEEYYGLPTVKNEELFGAVSAGQEEARILGVKPGHPLLKIEMLALTYKERPYEYRLAYVRTDERFVYRES